MCKAPPPSVLAGARAGAVCSVGACNHAALPYCRSLSYCHLPVDISTHIDVEAVGMRQQQQA